LIRGILSKSE